MEIAHGTLCWYVPRRQAKKRVRVCGKAGCSYIIEMLESLPNPEYPYTHILAYEKELSMITDDHEHALIGERLGIKKEGR